MDPYYASLFRMTSAQQALCGMLGWIMAASSLWQPLGQGLPLPLGSAMPLPRPLSTKVPLNTSHLEAQSG